MRPLKSIAALTALALFTVAAHAAPTRFTATVSGKGPDVIIIPGLASSIDSFAAIAARLSPTHRVHLLQVAPLAEEIDAYIRDNRLAAPAVIGHSLGGETALLLAERHPGDVGRVMVVDALPFFALLMNPQATVGLMKPQAAMIRDRTIGTTDDAHAASQPVMAARFVKTASARAGVIELMTTDLRPELPTIKAPVTVLYAWDPGYGVTPDAIDAMLEAAYMGTPQLRLSRIGASAGVYCTALIRSSFAA